MRLFICTELNIIASLNFYILEDLIESIKSEIELMTYVHYIPADDRDFYRELDIESFKMVSPVKSRIDQLKQIQENTRILRCEYMPEVYRKRAQSKHPEFLEFNVPLDPRFID